MDLSYIIFYICYSSLLIFSLLFLILFFNATYSFKQKDRIPTVYVYAMILCNVGVVFVEFSSDVFPIFLDERTYHYLNGRLGEYLTLFDNFVYAYPMFLTVLMVTERIYVIFSPFGHAFTTERLKLYCILLSSFPLIILLIPFFSTCPVNYDFYLIYYRTACSPHQHILTNIFESYNGIIPISCMLLNICLILHLYFKRKALGNITDSLSKKRQSHERTLLVQSISTTTFLLIYEITEHITNIFIDEYLTLSDLTRRIIYYSRTGSVALTCFYIYFIGTPAIRRIIICKMEEITGPKRKKTTIVRVGSSRDNSALF